LTLGVVAASARAGKSVHVAPSIVGPSVASASLGWRGHGLQTIQGVVEEINEPDEVLAKFRLPRSPGDLNSALSQIDELLNWKKRLVR
jgi:hypothetical protein